MPAQQAGWWELVSRIIDTTPSALTRRACAAGGM